MITRVYLHELKDVLVLYSTILYSRISRMITKRFFGCARVAWAVATSRRHEHASDDSDRDIYAA